MAPPSASARRRTRWVQGSIIAASTVIIIVASIKLAASPARATDQITPTIVTTVFVSPAPSTAPPAPVEEPAPAVSSTPAPTLTSTPTPIPTPASSPVVVSYQNCSEVWAVHGGPIHRGEPGYSADLDRDGDGTGCESQR